MSPKIYRKVRKSLENFKLSDIWTFFSVAIYSKDIKPITFSKIFAQISISADTNGSNRQWGFRRSYNYSVVDNIDSREFVPEYFSRQS